MGGVSILYWRCIHFPCRNRLNRLSLFQFSIGDAMPATEPIRVGKDVSFNSLLEMHQSHSSCALSQNLFVSILYWRCTWSGSSSRSSHCSSRRFNSLLEMRQLRLAKFRRSRGVLFQFSIGDAKQFVIEALRRSDTRWFQFSIGDAGAVGPLLPPPI